MGRLQRKKTSKTAAKKKQQSANASAAKANGQAVKKSAPASTVIPLKKRMPAPAPKATPSSRTPVARLKSGYLQKAAQFLREVKVELKKVTWPSRKQTIGSTVVVIILVMIIAFFLGIIDIGLSSIVRVVLK